MKEHTTAKKCITIRKKEDIVSTFHKKEGGWKEAITLLTGKIEERNLRSSHTTGKNRTTQ